MAKWEKFLIFLGVVFYVLLFPHGIHGDGSVRWNAVQNLLAGRIDPILYSYVHPLLSTLLLPLGYVIKDGFWWVSRFNTIVFLFTAFRVAQVLSRSWDPRSVRVLLLLLFCATMFPRHSTDYYSEVFSACMIVLAIFELQAARGWLAVTLVCLSVWNTPGTAVGGALLLAFFSLRTKSLRYALAVPLLGAGIMGETYLKFGELFPNAYINSPGFKNLLPYSGGPGFSYPLFFGLLSVFFSYGKGLLFYTPGIIGLFRRDLWKQNEDGHSFVVAGAVYFAGLLLVFSRFWAWPGDWFWGPRFYLFVSFLAVMVLMVMRRNEHLSLPWRIFWFLATALSFWVGCQGIMYGQDFLEDCYKTHGPQVEFMCWYVPEYSPLWRPFVVWPLPQGRKVAYLGYFLLVAGTVLWEPGKKILSEARAGVAAFWREYARPSAWRI